MPSYKRLGFFVWLRQWWAYLTRDGMHRHPRALLTYTGPPCTGCTCTEYDIIEGMAGCLSCGAAYDVVSS